MDDRAANTVPSVVDAIASAELDGTQYPNWKQERKHSNRAFYQSANGTLHHQTVPMCGHKFVPGQEPKHRNCEPCWFTFFNAHGELTQACDTVFKDFGPDGLTKIRGPKFAKNFIKFMSTLASWKKASEVAQHAEVNEQAGEAQPAEGS